MNTFKEIEIILNIFSDHRGLKLKFNYRKKTGKLTNMWRLSHMLLNSQWVKQEIKRKIKKNPETLKYTQIYETAKTLLRKFIVITAYIKKKERSQINNLNLHLKKLDKEKRQAKPMTNPQLTSRCCCCC